VNACISIDMLEILDNLMWASHRNTPFDPSPRPGPFKLQMETRMALFSNSSSSKPGGIRKSPEFPIKGHAEIGRRTI
jgi:hypothetical protein